MRAYIQPEPSRALLKLAIRIRKKSRVLYVATYPLTVIAFFVLGGVGLLLAKAGLAGERLCGWVGFDPHE